MVDVKNVCEAMNELFAYDVSEMDGNICVCHNDFFESEEQRVLHCGQIKTVLDMICGFLKTAYGIEKSVNDYSMSMIGIDVGYIGGVIIMTEEEVKA